MDNRDRAKRSRHPDPGVSGHRRRRSLRGDEPPAHAPPGGGARPRAGVELIVIALLADGHVLLEDYPGSGKTTLAKALGELDRRRACPTIRSSPFAASSSRRICCRPTSPAPRSSTPPPTSFFFRAGPVFAHILLADEINRTSPKVQSALLEAMAEKQVTVDNKTRPLDDLFFVIATQNPLDLVGTFPLPAAQLDRFLFKIRMTHIDRQSELEVLASYKIAERQAAPRRRSAPGDPHRDPRRARGASASVHVAPEVQECLVDIAGETRTSRARAPGRLDALAGADDARAPGARAHRACASYVSADDVEALAPLHLRPSSRAGSRRRRRGRRDPRRDGQAAGAPRPRHDAPMKRACLPALAGVLLGLFAARRRAGPRRRRRRLPGDAARARGLRSLRPGEVPHRPHPRRGGAPRRPRLHRRPLRPRLGAARGGGVAPARHEPPARGPPPLREPLRRARQPGDPVLPRHPPQPPGDRGADGALRRAARSPRPPRSPLRARPHRPARLAADEAPPLRRGPRRRRARPRHRFRLAEERRATTPSAQSRPRPTSARPRTSSASPRSATRRSAPPRPRRAAPRSSPTWPTHAYNAGLGALAISATTRPSGWPSRARSGSSAPPRTPGASSSSSTSTRADRATPSRPSARCWPGAPTSRRARAIRRPPRPTPSPRRCSSSTGEPRPGLRFISRAIEQPESPGHQLRRARAGPRRPRGDPPRPPPPRRRARRRAGQRRARLGARAHQLAACARRARVGAPRRGARHQRPLRRRAPRSRRSGPLPRRRPRQSPHLAHRGSRRRSSAPAWSRSPSRAPAHAEPMFEGTAPIFDALEAEVAARPRRPRPAPSSSRRSRARAPPAGRGAAPGPRRRPRRRGRAPPGDLPTARAFFQRAMESIPARSAASAWPPRRGDQDALGLRWRRRARRRLLGHIPSPPPRRRSAFEVRVQPAGAGLRVCLFAPLGTSLGCGDAQPAPGEPQRPSPRPPGRRVSSPAVRPPSAHHRLLANRPSSLFNSSVLLAMACASGPARRAPARPWRPGGRARLPLGARQAARGRHVVRRERRGAVNEGIESPRTPGDHK